jgi:hypothetical protein
MKAWKSRFFAFKVPIQHNSKYFVSNSKLENNHHFIFSVIPTCFSFQILSRSISFTFSNIIFYSDRLWSNHVVALVLKLGLRSVECAAKFTFWQLVFWF